MKAEEMLKAYVDGELSPTERVFVEDAAAKDPALREQIEWLQATSRRLKAASPQFEIRGKAETLAALKRSAPRRSATPWWMGGLSMAGVTAFALFAFLKMKGGSALDSATLADNSSATTAMATAPVSDLKSLTTPDRAELSKGNSAVEKQTYAAVTPAPVIQSTKPSKTLNDASKANPLVERNSGLPNRTLVRPESIETEVITVEVDDVELSENSISEAMKKAGFSVQRPGQDPSSLVLLVPTDRMDEAKKLLAASHPSDGENQGSAIGKKRDIEQTSALSLQATAGRGGPPSTSTAASATKSTGEKSGAAGFGNPANASPHGLGGGFGGGRSLDTKAVPASPTRPGGSGPTGGGAGSTAPGNIGGGGGSAGGGLGASRSASGGVGSPQGAGGAGPGLAAPTKAATVGAQKEPTREVTQNRSNNSKGDLKPKGSVAQGLGKKPSDLALATKPPAARSANANLNADAMKFEKLESSKDRRPGAGSQPLTQPQVARKVLIIRLKAKHKSPPVQSKGDVPL